MESFRPHRGFTLIELLVVFAIIMVITAVVITSQGSFNKSYVLSNTAYDIALTLRSAETFGLGTRAIGSTVNAGYGLHFDSTTPNFFTLFADTDPEVNTSVCTKPNCKSGDKIYTSGTSGDTFVQKYTLGNGITIAAMCAIDANGAETCGSETVPLTIDIVFERPNPNAHIRINGQSGTAYTEACVTLISPHDPDEGKHVKVHASGQITANATQCGLSS